VVFSTADEWVGFGPLGELGHHLCLTRASIDALLDRQKHDFKVCEKARRS
jgi:hypothetical protein